MLWLFLTLRWLRLLLKSLVRPENDGNVVLSNVLEEEASFDDVDIHEAIEDKTRGPSCQLQVSIVRGTPGFQSLIISNKSFNFEPIISV